MVFHYQSLGISAALQCILFIGASGFYAVMKPYKVNYKNNIDYLALMLLEIFSFEVLFTAYHTATVFTYYVLATALLLGVPHMILIFYICYMLAMKVNITHCIKMESKNMKRACMQATTPISQAKADVETESDTGSLPD